MRINIFFILNVTFKIFIIIMSTSRVENLAISASVASIVVACALKINRKKRSKWMKGWLHRILNMLETELLTEDIGSYNNFLRMSNTRFEEILNLIKHGINRTDTVMRQKKGKITIIIKSCKLSRYYLLIL